MVNEITENYNQKIIFFDRITRQVHMSVNDSLLIDPIFGITASRPLHQASHPCMSSVCVVTVAATAASMDARTQRTSALIAMAQLL